MLAEYWFLSERGAELIAILLVVLSLKKLWELIERGLGQLLNPKLREIEKAVQDTLRTSADAASDSRKRELVAGFFKKLKVQHYAFYIRGQERRFEEHISQMSSAPETHIELTDKLRTFLGQRRRRFVDLRCVCRRMAILLPSIPKLWRIWQKTGCRYLLPICLGESVRGLLFLPEGEAEKSVCEDALAEDISAFGSAQSCLMRHSDRTLQTTCHGPRVQQAVIKIS